jgi:Na+/phosphate symporter
MNSIKKSFCEKNTSKIAEKLSFLNTEEEMRKYFNIVDFDKKDADKIFDEELKRQQENFMESQDEFDNFDRKKLLEFINKYKPELQNMNKEEKQKNLFEIVTEYSLPAEKV